MYCNILLNTVKTVAVYFSKKNGLLNHKLSNYFSYDEVGGLQNLVTSYIFYFIFFSYSVSSNKNIFLLSFSTLFSISALLVYLKP